MKLTSFDYISMCCLSYHLKIPFQKQKHESLKNVKQKKKILLPKVENATKEKLNEKNKMIVSFFFLELNHHIESQRINLNAEHSLSFSCTQFATSVSVSAAVYFRNWFSIPFHIKYNRKEFIVCTGKNIYICARCDQNITVFINLFKNYSSITILYPSK